MAKSSTSFDENKQPEERKPRGKGKKSLMLDAIRDVCKDEKEFFKQVVVIGLGGWTQPEKEGEDDDVVDPVFQNPNPMLINMVLNRIEPPLKAIAPMVEFDFDVTLSPHEKADQILVAISDGKLAPDIGQMIINSIQSMLKIQEVTDIDERLKAIEELAKNGE